MFDQNTSVLIKATKYEIDTFASQVARNHAIPVYAHAYDEQHSFPYQKSNLTRYWPYNRKKQQNLCLATSNCSHSSFLQFHMKR